MGKYNFIYILALILLVICVPFIKEKLTYSDEYFGIAENQIRNINLEYPVEILKLNKLQGEAVHPGDTIFKLRRVDLEIKIQNFEFDKLQLEKKAVSDKEEFNGDLKILDNTRNDIKKQYQIKYAEIERNARLQSDLISKVIESREQNAVIKASVYQLNDLKDKETLELAELDLKFKNRKKEYDALQAETKVKISKLDNEIKFLTKSDQSLDLLSPEEGVIGFMELSPGDKIQAYNTLIKMYATHPNTVTIYIGDNQLSTLKLGDSVRVNSINSKNYFLLGAVTALGTRITPLPERLKKIPDLRAWGREVTIRIPAKNEFMQGEKVLVRIHK